LTISGTYIADAACEPVLPSTRRSGASVGRAGDVVAVLGPEVVDEDLAPVRQAPQRQQVRRTVRARAAQAAHAVVDGERELDQAEVFAVDADAEDARVHQLVHVAVHRAHDGFHVERGGHLAADLGQDRDAAVGQFDVLLLQFDLRLLALGVEAALLGFGALRLGLDPARVELELLALEQAVLLTDFGGARAHLVFQHHLLAAQAAHAEAVGAVRAAQHQHRRQGAQPPGVPERRQDRDRQRRARRAPYAVLVGGLDPEHIGTGIEVGVGRKALAGVGVDPVLVESDQLVGEAVALRGGVVQRRKLEREHRVGGVERDLGGVLDRSLQQPDGPGRPAG
jgi:hypothetical protein